MTKTPAGHSTNDSRPDPDSDSIEEGKRLIRLTPETGDGWTARLAARFYELTWRTPLHNRRLHGRFPLRLTATPHDPVSGDRTAGQAIRSGQFFHRGMTHPITKVDFATLGHDSVRDARNGFAEYVHSFAWLRDLAAVTTREEGARIAEPIIRQWLAAQGDKVTMPAWRGDIAGWRLFYWTAYAPLILSGKDLILRSAILTSIARTARHLDQSAAKMRPGLPQLVAYVGIITAGLILPGGGPRRVFGEAGLRKALQASVYVDGGIISRAPDDQLDLVMVMVMLRGAYQAVNATPPAFIAEVIGEAVPPILGLMHGDGGLGSWQGSAAIPAPRVEKIIGASGIRTRPLKQARDWGYQRMAAGKAVVLIDAAPPPVARITAAGCASTSAIEFSHGEDRIFVNCGGAALAGALIPRALARGLRTTAAHSTLVLDDHNSTAILDDGRLGKGVSEVALERVESEQGSRLEISHDGYVRRHGFVHRRLIILSPNGQELRGEDMLIPEGRRKGRDLPFAVRFHLAPHIVPTLSQDKQGVLLQIGRGPMWQMRVSGGSLTIEDSLWVDGSGRPHPSLQLAIDARVPAGGCSVGWIIRQSA